MAINHSQPYINALNGSQPFLSAETPNPWFNIANQFAPRNLADVIKWSRYILIQSPTTSEVLRKYSSYPVTEFLTDTKDEKVKKKYKEIYDSFKLKMACQDIGFDYHTLGNAFVSVYFPIHRSLECRSCKAMFNIRSAHSIKFRNFKFVGKCPTCDAQGEFNRKDTRSMDIKSMNLIKWSQEHMVVHHNPITGESEFFYKIPAEVRKKIRAGDSLYINSTPWGIIEAVRKNEDFKFDNDSIFHMKNISMGSLIDGIGIPPLISLFSLVFYQAVLRKANEAISLDYLAPLRVVYPTAQTAQSDPSVAFSQRNFAENIQKAMKKHKMDKNHILISPVPVGYANLGGEGKNLLVAQEIQQAEETMLLSLGVSRELLTGTTNWTSSTVGLRMLENTLRGYVSQLEEMLNWMIAKVASYLSLQVCKITLAPFKLSEDDNLKTILMNLVASQGASMTTLFESLGLDYHEELERMKAEVIAKAKFKVDTDYEKTIAEFIASKGINGADGNNDEYNDKAKKASELAQQLMQIPDGQRKGQLAQIRATDYPLYLMTAKILDTLNDQENSQQQQAVQQEQQVNGGS